MKRKIQSKNDPNWQDFELYIVKSQDLSNRVKTGTKIYRRMCNLFDFDMEFTATFG